MDADQGFMQKIFYLHVPLAIVALCGFVVGGIMAIQHLRTGDPRYDLRSYVAIHLSLDPRRRRADHGLDLGAGGAGATGGCGTSRRSSRSSSSSCSTRPTSRCASRSRTPSARPATRASSRSTAGAFVPLNFIAVRLAQPYTHPRVLGDRRRRPAGEDAAAVLPLAARHGAAVHDALALRDGLEARPRQLRGAAPQARRRRRRPAGRPHGGTAPFPARDPAQTTDALPDNTGYVAAAYLVFFALVLIYVVIMASKLARFERELAELNQLVDERAARPPAAGSAPAGAEPEEAARR